MQGTVKVRLNILIVQRTDANAKHAIDCVMTRNYVLLFLFKKFELFEIKNTMPASGLHILFLIFKVLSMTCKMFRPCTPSVMEKPTWAVLHEIADPQTYRNWAFQTTTRDMDMHESCAVHSQCNHTEYTTITHWECFWIRTRDTQFKHGTLYRMVSNTL